MLAHHSPTLAVSTWSLHRAIGVAYPNAPSDDVAAKREETWGRGTVALLDVPSEVARLGIDRLEICHFQIPGDDHAYLAELRSAISQSGVTLQTLLIDNGDITHPTEGRRDQAWVGRWIDVAAELGATRARVIAGKQQPSPETLDRSIGALRELARRGAGQGVRIVTENWFDLLSGPREVDYVLDRLNGEVGLLADFGNWHGASKYRDLAAIFARAETSHAKCHFAGARDMDSDDYSRCLEAASGAGYEGPYSLVYDGPSDDEWEGLRQERDFVRDYFARPVQESPMM
jgi:sugar phosphate isomerase/epimerase